MVFVDARRGGALSCQYCECWFDDVESRRRSRVSSCRIDGGAAARSWRGAADDARNASGRRRRRVMQHGGGGARRYVKKRVCWASPAPNGINARAARM